MPNTNIGLIIWGCKGGHKIFCSNNVVDYKEKSINDTIKDIRSFVRFNLVNLTTYALEFTDRYKAFTIYRSCNDSGTGGYVAIIVYVPHSAKIKNLRLMLDQMMDDYFKEYVHPIFGTYYGGKYDDIEPYNRILQSATVIPETDRFIYSVSTQDDKPHLRIYDDVKEVDAFFEYPYRREFFECQEVMFMSRDIYEKSPETLRFNFKEKIINKISDPERLPQLYVGDNNEVVYIKINGYEVDKSERHSINIETDCTEILIRCKYCDDYSINGLVSKLIASGKLIEKDKVISLGKVEKCYKLFPIYFKLDGYDYPEGVIYLQEENTKKTELVTHSSVQIRGDYLDANWDIYLQPLKGSQNSPIKIGTFKPSLYVDSNKSVEINIQSFSFKVEIGRDVSDKVFYVETNRMRITVPMPEDMKTVTLYFPQDIDSAGILFDVENSETEFSFENNVLRLTSKVRRYKFSIPDSIKSLIHEWNFKIGGESKKSSLNDYSIKLQQEDDISKGKLLINRVSYDYEVNNDFTISPKMLCITPEKIEGEYSFFWIDKSITTSGPIILPYKDKRTLSVSKKYEIYKSEEDSSIVFVTIREKPLAVDVIDANIDNVYDQPKETGQDDLGLESKFYITFYGCTNFYINVKDKIPLKNQAYLMSVDKSEIFDKNDNLLCVVFKDKSQYSSDREKANRKNGFTIEYYDNFCEVKYCGNACPQGWKSRKSSFVRCLSSKITIFSLLGLLLVVFIVGVFFFTENPKEILRVNLKLRTEPDLGEAIVTIDGLDDIKYASIDTTEGHKTIIIQWDDEASKECYQDLLSQKIVINIGEEKIKHYLANDNEVANYIKDLKEKEVEDKEFKPKEMPIYLSFTSSQEKIRELKNYDYNNDISCLISKCKKVMLQVHNEKAVNYILGWVRSKIRSNNMEELELFVNEFAKYSNDSNYVTVNKMLTKQREIAKERKKHEDKLKEEAEIYRKKLHSDSCSMETVIEVLTWWKNKKEEEQKNITKYYDFGNGLNVYEKFFQANEKTKMDAVYKNYVKKKLYFSENQQKIIKAYVMDSETYKYMKDYYGLQFAKPIEKKVHVGN